MECMRCVEEIEAHLECCPDCRKVINELAALREEINLSIAGIPIPTNLSVRILSAIEKEQQNTAKDIWLTGILLAVFASPVLLLFSRTFSSVFHLAYLTGTAFWRSLITLVTFISPWVTVSVGILSLFVMAIGLYIIKTLLTKFEVNEVIV